MQRLLDIDNKLAYIAASIDDVLNSREQIAADCLESHPGFSRFDYAVKILSRLLRKPYIPSSAAYVIIPNAWHVPDQDPEQNPIISVIDPRHRIKLEDYTGILIATLPYGPAAVGYKLLGSNVVERHKRTDWQSMVILHAQITSIGDGYTLIYVKKSPGKEKEPSTAKSPLLALAENYS